MLSGIIRYCHPFWIYSSNVHLNILTTISDACSLTKHLVTPKYNFRMYERQVIWFITFHLWKWKLLSHVWLFATPWNSPWNSPGQNTGVGSRSLLQGDLPNPGIEPRSPALQADSLPSKLPGKPKNIGVGSLSFLQGIFPTQESNWGLLYCKWILYQLSYQEGPATWSTCHQHFQAQISQHLKA